MFFFLLLLLFVEVLLSVHTVPLVSARFVDLRVVVLVLVGIVVVVVVLVFHNNNEEDDDPPSNAGSSLRGIVTSLDKAASCGGGGGGGGGCDWSSCFAVVVDNVCNDEEDEMTMGARRSATDVRNKSVCKAGSE